MTQDAIVATVVPALSALHAQLAQADFADAYRTRLLQADLTPAQIFLSAFRATPGWVRGAMALRNRIVRLFGLKDVGRFDASPPREPEDYGVGDRLGIFHVFGKSEQEIVLGIDDRHLDVRVSVLKLTSQDTPSYVMSTVVKVHNRLGRLYMVPVGRIHPLVVRTLMRNAHA